MPLSKFYTDRVRTPRRLILRGGTLVLPGRIEDEGTVVVEDGRIVEISSGRGGSGHEDSIDVSGHLVVPGFVDGHLHGLDGFDTLGPDGSIAEIAARLPRHGVTSFCPTTMACTPGELDRVLESVEASRLAPAPGSARVLPAHLESNFISPDFRGAQPLECLRLPPPSRSPGAEAGSFSADDVLSVIERRRSDVAIVTLAPELPGGLELVGRLRGLGIQVSLGHSGATCEQGLAAIEAGATRATHLFNRMPPLGHREPGLAGAVLASEEVACEIVCDMVHVHPAMVRVSLGAKGRSGLLAVSDAIAAAGLPHGAVVAPGGRAITAGPRGARLEDGTLAGSAMALGEAFRLLVEHARIALVDAVHICSTSPARSLGLHGFGVLAEGAHADLVVLDRGLNVRRTFVAGIESGPGPE